jgi:nitrous oxidase accessory protein
MMSRRSFLRILPYLALLLVLAQAQKAKAQTEGQIITPQGSFTSLETALSAAQDGDTIEVYGGVHAGPLLLDKSLTIVGHNRPVIDGGGKGTVLKLGAPDITLRGFVITNSGDSLDEENSGIAVEAPGAVIEDNYLQDTLFGIYLRQAEGSIIRDNVISSKDLDLPRRGDPIRVWYSNDVLIENNQVSNGRDVVLWYSENLTVRDNEVSGGRYGLHFMYCDDAIIENNVLDNNSVGTFLMYSRRLQLLNNTIAHNRGPSGFGVGLKDMDDAVIQNNLFLDNRIGAHLDNSPREVTSVGHFEGNVFAYNDVGVNLMPSVRHNEFSGNSFVDNEQQVSIAGGGGGRVQDNAWTIGDQGNYWSDYVGFDGDADGLGDIPFKSERLFEDLMDQNTSLRLFMYSPIEQAIDFAARAAPFVKPQPKLTDQSPLMEPAVPEHLPSLPEQKSTPFWVVSLGLLLLAVLVLALGSDTQWFKRRPKPRQSLPPSPQHPVAK